MIKCERCKNVIAVDEERELYGQILCEDCYMDLLSPTKTCDPWAVHSAKTLVQNEHNELELDPIQRKILSILRDEGPQSPRNLCGRLQIRETDLEKAIAALRHMEKVRGELRDGKKFIRLW